jgi:hypothetical protein
MFIVYHAKTEYGRENEKLFKQFVFFVNLSQKARNKKEGASPPPAVFRFTAKSR